MLRMRRDVAGLLTGLALMSISGCYQAAPPAPGAPPSAADEPREGYWDREHHRWWHEHTWHECDEHEPHCR
jgi:hypothetical protein